MFDTEKAIQDCRETLATITRSLANEPAYPLNDIPWRAFGDVFMCMFAAFHGYTSLQSLLDTDDGKLTDFCNTVAYDVETFFKKESRLCMTQKQSSAAV